MKWLQGTLFLITAFTLAAQNPPGVNQVEATRRQQDANDALRELGPGDGVPSLYAEEDADIGPQTILRKRRPTWFRGTVDSQVFYTDNLFFANRDGNQQEAGVAVTTLEAALTTPPCLTPFASYRGEVGYRHQFFNYFGNDNVLRAFELTQPYGYRLRTFGADDFDFDSSTAFADVIAQTKHYQFRAGFDYMRLLGFEPFYDDYEEFYHEYVPRWSVQRNFRVCDHSMFSVAYLGSYHFTEADVRRVPGYVTFGEKDRSDRWEHSLVASYSYALPCHVVVQPYYRFQYTDFVNYDRELYLHTVGFGIGWYPCEAFSVRGFFGYNWQCSDRNNVAEYEQLNGGGGLNVTLRF